MFLRSIPALICFLHIYYIVGKRNNYETRYIYIQFSISRKECSDTLNCFPKGISEEKKITYINVIGPTPANPGTVLKSAFNWKEIYIVNTLYELKSS